jgi:hypothetical protein
MVYSLLLLEPAKVVGNCDVGANRIVYFQLGGPECIEDPGAGESAED